MLNPVVKYTLEEGNTRCFASTVKSVLYPDTCMYHYVQRKTHKNCLFVTNFAGPR